MSEIRIERGQKFLNVLAAQARRERVDSGDVEKASRIISELISDMSPENRYKIGQVMAYTVEQLQKPALDFLNSVADRKTINPGDTPMFKVRHGGIKAYIQAKGATTARSYVADRQIPVSTVEVAARPAINIIDLRAGRVNMADLIREANDAMTLKKLGYIEKVLHEAIDDYASPFYGAGNGIVQATLDAQVAYFRRYGAVSLLGDYSAVSQLAPLTGMAMSNTITQHSESQIDEFNNNGFVGKYKGSNVISMTNTYEEGKTTPVLATDWIYILPAGATGDTRDLKIAEEGGVASMEGQSIDDRTYEVLLYQWFGAAFVVGILPTMGAYKIN